MFPGLGSEASPACIGIVSVKLQHRSEQSSSAYKPIKDKKYFFKKGREPSHCFFCLYRCNLASVMLQLLALKVPNVLNFDFMSKPSPGKWIQRQLWKEMRNELLRNCLKIRSSGQPEKIKHERPEL